MLSVHRVDGPRCSYGGEDQRAEALSLEETERWFGMMLRCMPPV